ncbi:glycosyltransferase [Pedobacter sp. BMA]|uniref:glycosyltransferase n=1 Tax=Pedobacter sp. BMA TaxID=1663685 RepID=UPI0006496524|nr:glycosyltransferase [Pedobacter sp. BMA]KLT63766.1 hypothetical protein AB669_20175 [Pedobacter sp. BMA]
MSFTIAFYVHHHGSGHLMRTLQIVSALHGQKIILMGSGLKSIHTSDQFEVIHLPPDYEEEALSETSSEQPQTFHYAPLGLAGIRNRTEIMTRVFKDRYPLLLVVDVSVEVTLLARLSGIPTIVIRQHGKRDDLPHIMAYQSAEVLLAPFPIEMLNQPEDKTFDKTFFTGGFSRFSSRPLVKDIVKNNIAILIGAGGSSINASLISEIAAQARDYKFHIIGGPDTNNNTQNTCWHGKIEDPFDLLTSCELIIGNTGHNTVMETASLNKRFIGIPEDRPFNEQVEKALSITGRMGIEIVYPADLNIQNWNELIQRLVLQLPDWSGVTDETALDKAAGLILSTGKRLFDN